MTKDNIFEELGTREVDYTETEHKKLENCLQAINKNVHAGVTE